MNSLIHLSYQSASPTVKDTIRSVLHNVQRLLLLFTPSASLVVVVDGVAPEAKLLTQRQRRLKSIESQLEHLARWRKSTAKTGAPRGGAPGPEGRAAPPQLRSAGSAAAHGTKHASGSASAGGDGAQREAGLAAVHPAPATVHPEAESRTALTEAQNVTTAPCEPGVELAHASRAAGEPWWDAVGCDASYWEETLPEADIVTGSRFVYVCERVVEQFILSLQPTGKRHHGDGGAGAVDPQQLGQRDMDGGERRCREWLRSIFPPPSVVLSADVRVSLSFSNEPGEGEMKLSNHLLQLWESQVARRVYSGADSVMLVSNDSDVVLAGIACVPYHNVFTFSPGEDSVTSLSELFAHWLGRRMTLHGDGGHLSASPQTPAGLPLVCLPSMRTDFVFLFLLSGGDYYAGVGAPGVRAMWKAYRHLRLDGGFRRRRLVSGISMEIDAEFLRAITNRNRSNDRLIGGWPRRQGAGKGGKGSCGGKGSASAEAGLRVLQGATWALSMCCTGTCEDYRLTFPAKEGISLAALRAAAHSNGMVGRVARTIPVSAALAGGGTRVPTTQSDSEATAGVAAPAEPVKHRPPSREEAVEPHHEPRPTTASAGDSTSSSPRPLLTPLQLYVAVMGKYAKVSPELREAIHSATSDGGAALASSTSLRYIISTVQNTFSSNVSMDALPLHEQRRGEQLPPQARPKAHFLSFHYAPSVVSLECRPLYRS